MQPRAEANILNQIAEKTIERVASYKEQISASEMMARARALNPDTGFPFENALRKEKMSFICEIKKASPSKGIIAADFPFLSIAKQYESAGADAISVLTEPHWFLGNDSYLTQVKQNVTIPVLRKDFTVDEYMIYQAKLLGADAILLICAI